jgi:hypothetical protein
MSSDEDYLALGERAQRYRQYALDAAQQAMTVSPELGQTFLALAHQWRRLAESVEEQMKRML